MNLRFIFLIKNQVHIFKVHIFVKKSSKNCELKVHNFGFRKLWSSQLWTKIVNQNCELAKSKKKPWTWYQVWDRVGTPLPVSWHEVSWYQVRCSWYERGWYQVWDRAGTPLPASWYEVSWCQVRVDTNLYVPSSWSSVIAALRAM